MALLMYLVFSWFSPLSTTEKTYIVERGTTLRAFTQTLHRDGILTGRFSFIALAYLSGNHRQLKAGEYRFEPGITQYDLLQQVVKGRTISYTLLIPEGWNFKEVMAALAKSDKIKHSLKNFSPPAIMQQLGYDGVHHEGRFYPDTYRYTTGTADTAILRKAYTRMAGKLKTEWAAREPGLPLQTADEALILASIVEKETGVPDERPEIAGVFINRLRIGMRLQTDPTVIYGLGNRFDGNLRKRDMRRDTPYNTYTRKGLPPTPIAMPGGEAIHAVLHPAKTKNLYFVSRGDGTHKFSETFKEHRRAVVRYQLGGRRKK